MKKILLTFCLLAATIAATAADFQSGDLYYNILDEDAATVEVCAPPSGSYNLSSASGYSFPETVTYNGKTYTVTTVGVGAFKNARFSSSNTNKVYPMMWLGYNLVEIKSEGFAGCSLNLTGFRSALTTIAPDAFKDNKINWFNINGNSVYTSVNGVIFTQNSTHLTIFGGVHCSATQGGTNFVTSYTIPSGTVAIDDYAMSGNQKITTLNLGSVQSIGKEACARMAALKTLTIPATATTIAPDAFLETSGITTLNVNLTEPVQGVVFDDAVYERLRDKVNFAADANIAAFQADPNWGKFFSKTYPKLYLAGDMTDWANGKLEMNCDNDGNYSITVANVANGAKFKFVNEDASVWYGGETTDANYRVHSGWCTDIALSTSGQNFIIDGTGTLTFNVSADMKLTITGWAAGVYLTGTMTNNWVDREELIVSDGKFTITREMVAGDEFKFVDYANTWYGAVSNGAFVVTDEYLNTELSVTSPGENFKITADNTYVLTFDKANMKFTIEPRPLEAAFQVGKLWYKPVSKTEVEITPDPSGVPYNVKLDNANEITETVTSPNSGTVYTLIGIGENAFKDGAIGTNPSVNGTAHCMEYFFMPATITYISAHAFDNCTSNYPGIRLNNMTTIDDLAFVNNKINWFNTAMSGPVFKINGDNSLAGSATGGELYKEIDGVKTLVCYPGNRHKSAYKTYSYTPYEDNPNYTLTTSADLSFFNVIGPNTFYNNKNITSVTFGASTTAIETDAFKGATAITRITCNATVPPTGAVFEDAVIAACKDKLVIPAGSEAAYRADENWGKFFSTKYAITVTEAENGTVTADKAEAAEGETVTLTVTPAEDYQLATLAVMNGETEVETTTTETGATFVMPAAAVTVTATFTPIPTYAITVAEAENGTVTADKQTAKAGETVTLTVTPAEDYQLASLTVMNGETEVETTTTETGATFVMPAAAVAVTATFEAIPEPLPGDVFFVDPMYYKVVDENAATCEYAPNPNGPYNVTFASSSALTATVVNPDNGKTYTVIGVGENAFKDGTINSNAATGAISYNHMWWWPNTISYIRAGAFENTSSNFPCIRFNSGFTPGSIDKAAFINNRINQFNPSASGDYYKVTDYNAGNTGDANGRSGLLYCEENGKKILLVFGGDHHRSSWEKIPDGTQGKANPNYTLTTSVDLSEFNVIGENAFYGNQNIQAITLGANLEAIETNAFKNVTSITSITCNATVPPTGAVFEDVVYEACKDKLVIPAGSEAAYRADENWGKFFSPVSDSYAITVAEAENGTVIADKVEAEEGETVTVTATPAQGYELTSLTYTAEGAEPQAIENGQFTMPAANVTINATFSLITAELNGVSFANNTYASWYGDQNLAVPENVTAYVVTGIEGDVTIIEEVGYIPAGVGVLLYSTTPADVVNTTAYTGQTAEVASMLQGYLEDTAIADGYVLYKDVFVLAENGTLPAHRCYLPKSQAPAGAPMRLSISQNGGVVTAIDDVRTASDGTVKYVNPMGQVSDRPFQGVNIVVDGNKTYKVIKN